MLYIFFAIACVCSNYMIASEKEQQDKVIRKAQYDKIISDKIKDDKERAKYNEGYIVISDGHIIPYPEIHLPIGNENCFMSFPIEQYNKIMIEAELK